MADPIIPVGPRKGGLIDQRLQAMEQAAGAVPPPTVVATPVAPVTAATPAAPLSPEEIALRRKYGMAIPGEAKPSLLGKIKNALGFAPAPAPVVPTAPPQQ